MIHLPVVQGGAEWRAARLGIPTASCFDKILTPSTLKLSSSSEGYRNLLLAEWLLGESMDAETYDFTDRGLDMEEEAKAWYEMQRDVELEPGGFVLRDNRLTGCSPDGLIGTAGGLELKCPKAATHVGYLLDTMGDKYRCQVQGCLWITEREWWDVLSYHPSLPRSLTRAYRDEKVIAALEKTVAQFCEYLEEGKRALEKRGIRPPRKILELVA